jgi:hypothetical protein
MDKPIERIWAKAQQVVKLPYVHGHSDVGDVLVRYARGAIDEEKALRMLGYLEQAYLK